MLGFEDQAQVRKCIAQVVISLYTSEAGEFSNNKRQISEDTIPVIIPKRLALF